MSAPDRGPPCACDELRDMVGVLARGFVVAVIFIALVAHPFVAALLLAVVLAVVIPIAALRLLAWFGAYVVNLLTPTEEEKVKRARAIREFLRNCRKAPVIDP